MKADIAASGILPVSVGTNDELSSDDFRRAMSRLGAAVNFVTTNGANGRYGLLVSAVCSVTDDPPTVLVCINRASKGNATIKGNGVLCVNVLAGKHEALFDTFSAPHVTDRFKDGRWDVLETDSPALLDASATLDCSVTAVAEVGTHSVFFAQVVALRVKDAADGLVWFARRYHRLSDEVS